MGVVLLHGTGRHVGVICLDCNDSNDGRKVLLFALRLVHRKCSGVRRQKSITSNEKCCIALQHCCMAPEFGLPRTGSTA